MNKKGSPGNGNYVVGKGARLYRRVGSRVKAATLKGGPRASKI